MSPEERQLLNGLFERVRTASATPRDREAEELIEQETRRQPYATYYLAQAVAVQEKGLEAAANRIRDLEDRIRELEAGESDHRRAEQGGGFLSSIFGSSQSQQRAPMQQTSGPWSNTGRPSNDGRGYDDGYRTPPPSSGYQPSAGQPSGPWSGNAYRGPSAGSSFLTGALGTAAGVAGGMLLANSLSGIFSNHMSGAGLGNPLAGAGAFGASEQPPVEETVVNNYYGDDAIREASDNGDDGNTGNDNDGWQQADYGNNDGGSDQSDFGGNDDSLDI
ncbi:hypothetical protein SAMN03159496_03871 [Rhizobium sp. NFR07]|uniref:DUF2076 domain-containing protein n=1 Tax=Rhizobium sp. NFR07 TaxID=1566262 RepID=UPI0008DF4726|nr:DUF2076 domain-containing protein [Rhizobium sp. NFR07]SFB45629.1 hypothetical protein SAMN03159496_03871 [Rhizobium sp. NFR07]